MRIKVVFPRALLLCFFMMTGILFWDVTNVKAGDDIDENMKWSSVLKIESPECEVKEDGYVGYSGTYDTIVEKKGGPVTLSISPKEGYAVYYRKFKEDEITNMNNPKRLDEAGLIQGGESKEFVFVLPEEHYSGEYEGYPFVYIVLKEKDGKYYKADGTEFHVETAESEDKTVRWPYGRDAEKLAKGDKSWFFGGVTQTVREKLLLDSVKISNATDTNGGEVQFDKNTFWYYPNVKNGKDITMTTAVDYHLGGSVECKIDGGEPIYPDSEGRITIPGLEKVGTSKRVQLETVPKKGCEFDQASSTYSFTITRIKGNAPLENITVTGTYKPFENFAPETYDYSVAVDQKTEEIVVRVSGSENSTSIQYQIDKGEKQDVPKNGKITVPITDGGQPLLKIYTTADADSDLYQDGVYTIQVLQKHSQEELLKRAEKTAEFYRGLVSSGSTLNSVDAVWTIMELKTYGENLEALGITKESYLNSKGLQELISKWDNHGGYFQEKAVMGLLSVGYTLDELSMFPVGDKTVNLVQEDFLNNFSSLWALADDNFRSYLGEDLVLERALELSKNQKDTGEYIDSHTGGTDGTAMSIQAFSTWYGENQEITASVDKALGYLSSVQNKATGLVPYSGYGYYSSETISQWIVALCSLGIDPNKAEAFTSDSGLGLVDVLIDYFMLENGTFEHIQGQGKNGMATEQAFRALAAYKAFLENKGEKTFVFDLHTTQPWTGTEAVAATIKAIDAIGTVNKESGKAIETARTAYDALNEAEQKSMPVRYLEILTKAETAYAPLKPVADTEALIAAIGEVTLEKEAAIQAAQAAFDALSEEQKKQVENASVLEAASKALAADKATVAQIQEKLNGLLPLENLTTAQEEEAKALQQQIKALRQDMYDALENADQIDAIVQRIEDLKDAEKVEALIDAIGTVDSLEDEAAVIEAKQAYDALGEAKQALLKEGYKEKLEQAVAAVQELKDNAAVQNVIDNINKLVDENGEIHVSLEDGEFLASVRALYDQVDAAGLGNRVTNRDILFQAEAMYTELVAQDAADKILALPPNDTITGTAEDGSDIVMTEEQLNSILEAQTTYEALTDEQKAKVGGIAGEEAMNNYYLDVQTAETYSGYIEAVLSVFVQKVMALELPLTNADINVAKANLEKAQALIEQYESNEAAQSYLNSLEGFAEKRQQIEAEILRVHTDLANAQAVDQMIGALPSSITSDEEREAAQAAVSAIRTAYENLNSDAQNYVLRMAEVDTVELLIANYDKAKEEAVAVEKVIQEALNRAEESLTADGTVEAVKTAEKALADASVTAKNLVSADLKTALAALPERIQGAKAELLQKHEFASIAEKLPYDVTVEISLEKSGKEYEALKDALQSKKKAEIAESIRISAYQVVWDEEKQAYAQQAWTPQGGFTITLKTDSNLSGKEIMVGQYQENGDVAYITVTAGEGQVTFKADSLTVYALGLKEKAAPDDGKGDGNNTGGNNTGGNNAGGNNAGGNNAGGNNAGGTNTGSGNKGNTPTGSKNTGGTTAGGSAGVPKTGDFLADSLGACMALLTVAAVITLAAIIARRKERSR